MQWCNCCFEKLIKNIIDIFHFKMTLLTLDWNHAREIFWGVGPLVKFHCPQCILLFVCFGSGRAKCILCTHHHSVHTSSCYHQYTRLWDLLSYSVNHMNYAPFSSPRKPLSATQKKISSHCWTLKKFLRETLMAWFSFFCGGTTGLQNIPLFSGPRTVFMAVWLFFNDIQFNWPLSVGP